MPVAWFPKAEDLAGNPYWPRLQAELENLGIEFESSNASTWIARRWLLEHRRTVRVLHFHFIQPQYIGTDERASLRRLIKFSSDLLLARLLGYRIVWTMHDLMPTWPKEPAWVERLARYAIAWLAHDVIVHCQEAQHLLRRNFGRSRRVWVLSHPSYVDDYPNMITLEEARSCLGIPLDKFVIGFIGGIRPNKGLETLISAFEQVDSVNSLLLIAGRPWPPSSYVEEVRRLAEFHPNIVLRAQEIPDQEMQVYIKAANVLAFPFDQALTSGSVNLAMSFGRPVIVPQLGCLPELVGQDSGFIYEPSNVANLAAIIELAAKANMTTMGAAALQRATVVTWRDLAAETVKVYSGAL